MAAYACAVDQSSLEPVSDAPDALRCPTCGHRTDSPGVGLLADGFDVVHRQWGRRGDVHAWQAMRDLVGGTPTPPDRDAVRAAYVDALRQVADVDVDHAAEAVVHRQHLDHGGMSGGDVDVEWWRTRGLPLLVDRAVDRRPRNPLPPPTAPRAATPMSRRTGRTIVGDIVVWTLILAIPGALVGGGAFLLYQRAVGTRVDATVLECDSSGTIVRGASTYRTDCIAEWTIDGETVIGPFTGGNGESDVGKTLDATVRDGTAYSRSLILPIVLLALGLPFLGLVLLPRVLRRRSGWGRTSRERPDTPVAST